MMFTWTPKKRCGEALKEQSTNRTKTTASFRGHHPVGRAIAAAGARLRYVERLSKERRQGLVGVAVGRRQLVDDLSSREAVRHEPLDGVLGEGWSLWRMG